MKRFFSIIFRTKVILFVPCFFLLFLFSVLHAAPPTCGGLDQNCCVGNTCRPPNTCQGGKCKAPPPPCGGLDQNCCAGGTCGPALTCRNGKCKAPPPPCGGLDQDCCAGGTCGPGLTCRDGKCRVICGGIDQPCCPGNVCLRADSACENNKCVKRCGDNNQACCDGTQCNTGYNCVAGKCLPCGKVGLPCCQTGNKCEPGFSCDLNGLLCAQCGSVGQLCCSGNRCASGNVCLPGPEGARRCGPCGGPSQDCCPGNTCTAPGHECRNGKCRGVCGDLDQPCCPGYVCFNGACISNKGGYSCWKCPDGQDCKPDITITEVKSAPRRATVAVTVKNVGTGPTNTQCSVHATIYTYNPLLNRPSKWEPDPGCFNKHYPFNSLWPGQSVTVETCGYSPDQIRPGLWTNLSLTNRCGGDPNDANNQFNTRKEPDEAYLRPFYPVQR